MNCSILKRKLNEVDWVWSAVTTPETAFMDGRLHQDQVRLTPETTGWLLWPPGPRQVTLSGPPGSASALDGAVAQPNVKSTSEHLLASRRPPGLHSANLLAYRTSPIHKHSLGLCVQIHYVSSLFIFSLLKILFILATPCGMWDLKLWHVKSSSPTRARTWGPYGRQILNHWTTREVPSLLCLETTG